MPSTETLVTGLVGLAVAVGVVGTVLPLLPGLWLVWAAILGYGLILGFGWVGIVSMILVTGLLLTGTILGVRIPQRSAAEEGLSRRAQLAGLLLAVVGFFAIPVIGAPIGFVAGVWLSQWWSTRQPRRAWRSTRKAVVAIFKASAAQVLCAVGMASVWGTWVLAR